MVAQTPINHIIFLKECNEIFSDAYVQIALTESDFWLRSAQNYKKCTFLDNLRTITKEGNMETRQMTPFENSQNSCGHPLDPFWSIKYLILGKSYRFG